MNIKELFDKAENGTLTYTQFESLAKEANAKFADLSTGEYVSKSKYESELEAKTKEIETLNDTVATRNTDLEALKKQLEDAGTDVTKLGELTSQFENLKTKYDTDMKAYKEQLKQQEYEFAVKEFANSKKFTSDAAKRDFTRQMIESNLKLDKGKIIGAEDFTTNYRADNATAFVEDVVDPTPAPQPTPEPKPQFAGPTPGAPSGKQVSLSEMMKMANENPGMSYNF